MTEDSTTAVQIALAYYQAWTSHDFDQAMTYVAEDIVCQAPAGRYEGAEAFRGFMGPFVQSSPALTCSLPSVTTRPAMLMYDADTVPVHHAPGAEFVTVTDGKISQIKIIFDRLPFEAARRAAG